MNKSQTPDLKRSMALKRCPVITAGELGEENDGSALGNGTVNNDSYRDLLATFS